MLTKTANGRIHMGLATTDKHFSIGLCYKDRSKSCCNWDGKGQVMPFDRVKTDANSGPCANDHDTCPWIRNSITPGFKLTGPVSPYPKEIMPKWKPDLVKAKVKVEVKAEAEVREEPKPEEPKAKKPKQSKRAKKDTEQLNMFGGE